MAVEANKFPSVAETVSKFGGKYRSDAKLKKAILDAGIQGSVKPAQGKSLFVCFVQIMSDDSVSFVVKSIKLSDVDGRLRSSSTSTSTNSINFIPSKLLRPVGYTPTVPYIDPRFVSCGLFGSRIVFTGMPDYDVPTLIWALDVDETVKPNSLFKPYPLLSFNHVKYAPKLVELQGKLYAFNCYSKDPEDCFIDVFDPTQGIWTCLPYPYFNCRIEHQHFSTVIAGHKILLSHRHVEGVFCFEPEIKDWKKLSSLGAGLPFEGNAVRAFDACGGFLMFNYEYGKPETISVFFMSGQFDSVKPLKPVKLPCLPDEFKISHDFSFESFDHLGGGARTFCLVLNTFFTKVEYEFDGVVYNDFPQHKNKGFVLFITFEYEITKSDSGSELECTYKILNMNQIEYTPHTEVESAVTLEYLLYDTFVLSSREDETQQEQYRGLGH